MTPEADSQTRLRRRLFREALICLALFVMPALVLFPYTRWRPDAKFHATVRTRELTFTAGDGYRGRGVFAGGRADLTFDNFDHVRLPSGAEIKGGHISFHNVEFQALPLPEGTPVTLEWDAGKPGGVRILATYGAAATSPVRVFCKTASSVESDKGPLSVPSDGRADIYPTPGTPLAISLDPRSDDPKKPGELIFESDPVYLSPKEPVQFLQGSRSAILGFESVVDVQNAGRKQKVLQTEFLKIADLREGARISDLRIGKTGMTVDVQGFAGTLAVDDRDIRPSPVEYLRSNGVLSTWITMSLLIGTSLLTVASRFRIVKILGKET